MTPMPFFKKIIIIVLAILLVAGLGIFVLNRNGNYEILEITESDLIRIVEVTGKVIPDNEVSLAFEVTGRVKEVSVDTGDKVSKNQIIASLDKSKISADLQKLRADLNTKEIELSDLSDTNQETLLLNRKRLLESDIREGYTVADVAIKSQTDQMFTDPDKRTLEVTKAITDGNIRNQIEAQRVELQTILSDWSNSISNLNEKNINDADYNLALDNLYTIRDYLKLISSGLSDSVTTTSVDSTTLVRYKTDVSSARNSVETAIQNIIVANDDLRSTYNDKAVKQSEINSTEAGISSLQAEFNKFDLLSPLTGIISKIDLEIGEIVSSNKEVVSIISDQNYIIEAFIPEVNIAKVDVGNEVEFTLDAFGKDQFFRAEVYKIDPTETVKDGISTYRIEILINEGYQGIKPGMTANIKILSDSKSNRILIPRIEVKTEDNKHYVYLKKGSDIVKTEVKIGINDGAGKVEILEGLNVGDLIVLNYSE